LLHLQERAQLLRGRLPNLLTNRAFVLRVYLAPALHKLLPDILGRGSGVRARNRRVEIFFLPPGAVAPEPGG
jgi:hypothetical protein